MYSISSQWVQVMIELSFLILPVTNEFLKRTLPWPVTPPALVELKPEELSLPDSPLHVPCTLQILFICKENLRSKCLEPVA